MPRNPENISEFIAGQLPVIKFNKKDYYVDGRMKNCKECQKFHG